MLQLLLLLLHGPWQKNLKYPMQIFIVVAAGLAIILLKGFLVTLLLITISGFMGFIFLKIN